jgi:ADP-ribosylglycohydrolase
MQSRERYRGSLLGLAVGDALGAPLEGNLPGWFQPLEDMEGQGLWTDDTAMALCLADSLIACQGFDPLDQMRRYLRWLNEGYLSSRDFAFGIGQTVFAALERFEETDEPFCGSADPRTAGNGCIMRLAPVPLAFAQRPREAIEYAAQSSRTTHAAAEAVDACRYFAALIVGAAQGVSKDELLADHFTPAPGIWQEAPLAPRVAEIAAGSFKQRNPPEIRGTGYVVESLEAALWAFHRSDSFREGALLAVNLGYDTDTTGAVYGQLAGAFYGEQAIPEDWRARIARRELIESFADQLFALAGRQG